MALIYYIPDSISSSHFQASWSRVPRKFVACTFTCHRVGYLTLCRILDTSTILQLHVCTQYPIICKMPNHICDNLI